MGGDVEFEVLASDYPRGHAIGLHAHEAAQIVFARNGVMRVSAPDGVRVVPPARAVFIPPRMPHAVRCTTALAMRSVYIRGAPVARLSTHCVVLTVSPLMREVIIRLVEGPASLPQRRRLGAILLDELQETPTAPLHLPEPSDQQLARIAALLAAEPGDPRPLEDWAAVAGASRRTLARRFVADTGMTFGAWRRQLRFLAAIERLAAGEPVTGVAFDVGYDSVSAFIHSFRRTLGVTPKQYFADGG